MYEAPAIDIQSLCKMYLTQTGAQIAAVGDLNLSIRSGQVVGVVGLHHAGKTSLIKLIGGVEKPSLGRIRIFGHDLALRRRSALQHIGTALEGGSNLAGRHTVWDTLTKVARGHARHHAEIAERAAALLNDLNLWDRRGDAVRNLSHAMRQYVAIARALVCDPSIVLIDVPIEDTDPHMTRVIRSWIEQFMRRGDRTLLITARQIGAIRDICDRVVVLADGQVVADQARSASHVLLEPAHYSIRIRGHLDVQWGIWFDGLDVRQESNGETVISGVIADQSALYGLLTKVRNLALPLVSVTYNEPELEYLSTYVREA